MVLEVREVSRKTPRDGRLEISDESARRLRPLAATLTVVLDDQRGPATLESMACACEKGGTSGGHLHHFVAAPLLMSLVAGETVVVELLDAAVLAIARPHPLHPGHVTPQA